jgi:membrane protease YdiL (CAAX protease family)
MRHVIETPWHWTRAGLYTFLVFYVAGSVGTAIVEPVIPVIVARLELEWSLWEQYYVTNFIVKLVISVLAIWLVRVWLRRSRMRPGRFWGKTVIRWHFLAVAAGLSWTFAQMLIRYAVTGEHDRPPTVDPAFTFSVSLALDLILHGIVVAFSEEAVFRGIVHRACLAQHGPIAGIVLSGLIFGGCHLTMGSTVVGILSVICFGAGSAAILQCSGSLLAASLMHVAANASLYITYYIVYWW